LALIKSISGIRGTIGGNAGDNLTPIEITSFAASYASFIKKSYPNATIIIGRDGRITGETIKNIVINTLVMSGLDVIDVDLSTTPTVEMMVILEKAQGGIIISASHNPMNWNALKLLNHHGEFLDKEDGEALIKSIDENDYSFVSHEAQGKVERIENAIERHIQSILDLEVINVNLIRSKNFKVVVDPVNSTGALAIPLLLEALNCEYKIINGEISGQFNHNAEPKPEHLTELCEYIKNEGADLGVAVDPDVDRLAFVDENGVFIGEEYTIVLAADFILSKKQGNTVSNLSSSRALKDITQSYGGDYTASAVGEVNVVSKMKSTDAVIGGEGNGGVIYPGLHYGRDGLLGIAFVLNHMAETGKTLSELRSTYNDYTIVKDKIELPPNLNVEELIKSLQLQYDEEETNTLDGLKIDFEDGWVHLRKSNTEPIIRVYAESSNESRAKELAKSIKKSALCLI
jgi:phosphomannomutase